MKNILLCCAGGMSTSLLVQKMQHEAEARGLDVDIDACGVSQAPDRLDGVGVLLLAPQVAYARVNIEDDLEAAGVKLVLLDMLDFGRMNAKKIIDEALSALDGE